MTTKIGKTTLPKEGTLWLVMRRATGSNIFMPDSIYREHSFARARMDEINATSNSKAAIYEVYSNLRIDYVARIRNVLDNMDEEEKDRFANAMEYLQKGGKEEKNENL
jgi:hypothetical protein